MRSHPNARLTQKGRLRLVTQYLEHGRSPCFTYRWLAQYRAGGPTSLADRSAAPGPLLHHAWALSQLGLGRLRKLEPKPAVQRYEWERPGDLIHVDVKPKASAQQ